jgi:ketosteroid isomerase-like protein
MAKSRLVLVGILFILVVSVVAYVGSKNQTAPTPTPTVPTTPSPTTSPPIAPTIPVNDNEAATLLISAYHQYVKTKSHEDVLGLFTDDAVLITTMNLKLTGKSQISGYYNSMFSERKGQVDLQVLDFSVTIEGSKATARTRIAADGKLGMEYFELSKVKGLWKISGLTLSNF